MRFTSLLSYRNWEEIGASQLMTAEPLPPVQVRFELSDINLREYEVGQK
jgi:hypothetical protein